MSASTPTRADQLREAKHPACNDRKLHFGTFSSNLSGGCSISAIDSVPTAKREDTSTVAAMGGGRLFFDALVPVGRWRGFGGPPNFNASGFECFTAPATTSRRVR